jgi:putative ABC transport system permease protein
MSAIFHKSLADNFRRPVRSLLVILGIALGVTGLTGINIANDSIYGALAYSADETTVPNITLTSQNFNSSQADLVRQQPKVDGVQLSTHYVTRWQIPTRHTNLTITAYPDLQHVTLQPFQLTQGHLPDAGLT